MESPEMDYLEKLERALLDIAASAGGGATAINNWCRRHAQLLINVRRKYGKPPGVLNEYLYEERNPSGAGGGDPSTKDGQQ